MMARIVPIILLSLLVSACSMAPTAYQPAGAGRYGYADVKYVNNSYLVVARGNSASDRERVQKMILLRAAALTKENNYPRFEVLSGEGVFSNTQQDAMDPLLAFRGGGFRAPIYRPVVMRSYQPGFTYTAGTVYEYWGVLRIRMVKKGTAADLTSFDAQKVIDKLEPQLRASK